MSHDSQDLVKLFYFLEIQMKKYLKNYLTWLFIGFWMLTVLILWFLFIRARQTTSPTNEIEANKLYVGAGETLNASKRNALVDKSMSCPSWFVLIQNQWNILWCMQNDANTAATFPNAEKDCFDRFGWRLPSYGEIVIAAKSNLVNASVNYDMVDDMRANPNTSPYRRFILYARSTWTPNTWPITSSYPYRCFINK